MKLILHIGMHKTGSTAIQAHLANNRELLRGENVHVPEFATSGHHGLVFPWIELPNSYRLGRDPVDVWRNLSEQAKGAGVVFISSEEFSRQLPHCVRFDELEQLAHGFDEVQIVIVLRNQLSFIESVYKEIARNKAFMPFSEALSYWIRATHADGLDLFYERFLQSIQSTTKKTTLEVMLYEELCAANDGFIVAFFKKLGIAVPRCDEKANESSDSLAFKLCCMVENATNISPCLLKKASEFLRERHGAFATTLYTKQQEKQVFDIFIEHNFRLLAQNAMTRDRCYEFLYSFVCKNKIYADVVDSSCINAFKAIINY